MGESGKVKQHKTQDTALAAPISAPDLVAPGYSGTSGDQSVINKLLNNEHTENSALSRSNCDLFQCEACGRTVGELFPGFVPSPDKPATPRDQRVPRLVREQQHQQLRQRLNLNLLSVTLV